MQKRWVLETKGLMEGLSESDSLELGGKLCTVCTGILKRGHGLAGVRALKVVWPGGYSDC